MPKSTEEYLDQYMGEHPNTGRAFMASMQDRHKDPKNLNLRDAEHALFAQTLMESLGPIVGTGVVGTSVPAYSAAKVIMQNYMPRSVAKGIGKVFPPLDLADSTPPDLSELYWGLRPIWNSVKKPKGTAKGLSDLAPSGWHR